MSAKTSKLILSILGCFVGLALVAGCFDYFHDQGGALVAANGVEHASEEGGAIPVPRIKNTSGRMDFVGGGLGLTTGSAFVIERSGDARIPVATGTFTASSESSEIRVPVVNGEWSVSLPSDQTWTVTELWREGHRLNYLPQTLLSGERCALVGHAYDGVFLDAIDDLGKELGTVSVHHRVNWPANTADLEARHPGNLELTRSVFLDENSPVYLPRLDGGIAGYWITSEYHSWSYLPSNMTGGGGLHTAQLVLGASLVVDIDNFEPTYGMRLFIVDEGDVVTIYNHIDRASHVIEGLPPMSCRGYLSFDSDLYKDAELAKSEEVRLYPGGLSSVSLAMPNLPTKQEHGVVKGTLLIEAPEMWRLSEAFERIAVCVYQDPSSPGFKAVPAREKTTNLWEMVELLSTPEASVWELPEIRLPNGEYRFVLNPFGISEIVQVRAQEITVLDLRIPPVAITTITVASEGKGIATDGLIARAPEGAHGQAMMRADPAITDGGGAFDLQLVTLPGRIQIRGHAVGYPPISHECRVEAGWNYEEIAVVKCPVARLRALDKTGVEVDLGVAWFRMTAQPMGGGEGRIVNRTVDRTVQRGVPGATTVALVYFSEPGEYSLQFPGLEGGMKAQSTVIAAAIDSEVDQILVFE